MLEIRFKENKNTLNEIEMGTKWNYFPLKDEETLDAISATANVSGFTPLTAIANHYALEPKMITKASEMCNSNNEVCVLNLLKPNLFLVPKTRGVGDTAKLVDDLIAAMEMQKCQKLRFTHFSFIQNTLSEEEILTIFTRLKELKTSIKTIIWDVDSRTLIRTESLYNQVFEEPFILVK